MQEPRKSTLLFVQDAAAEPAALGAFAAEQPALALVTADGLDEAERKIRRLTGTEGEPETEDFPEEEQ